MMLQIATIISFLIMAYLGLGLLYALWFVTRTTKDAPIAGLLTRLMLIPGALLLWPLLMVKGRPS